MSKHDSWVKLQSPSPYDSIIHLFPQGIPMRDPYAMATGTTPGGSKIALWVTDNQRPNETQSAALARLIAEYRNASVAEVVDEATNNGGFAINSESVTELDVGPEAYARIRDWAILVESHAGNLPLDVAARFFELDYSCWVEGDEIPPPLPQSIDEVEPFLRTPELERAIQKNRINQMLEDGNYSVMDVLSGRAMVDVLNQIDPDSEYSRFWRRLEATRGDDAVWFVE